MKVERQRDRRSAKF